MIGPRIDANSRESGTANNACEVACHTNRDDSYVVVFSSRRIVVQSFLERLRADFPLVIELINDIWLPQADAKFRDVNTLRRII